MGKLRFTPDCVSVEAEDSILELGYWHAGLTRVRRSKAEYGAARYDVPARPVLMADGRPFWHIGTGEVEVLQSIPHALRAVAAPFLSCQWLALEAMRHVDGFADFLRQELAGGGPNFVLCCWQVGRAHSIGPVRRLATAMQMMRRPRAALLAELSNLPDVDAQVVRLLAKAVPENVGPGLLVRLVGLAGNPVARRSMQALPRLTLDLTEALCLLPPWLHHPEIAKAIAEGASLTSLRERLDMLLPHVPDDRRPAVLRSLAGARGWGELSFRMRNWAVRLRLEIPFPLPPIPGSDLLRPIVNGAQLVAEGEAMQHCVANYEEDVRGGRAYFFRWLGEERATVQLSRTETGTWHLREYLGRWNTPLTPATADAIRREVAVQMATLQPPDPQPLDTYVAGTAYHRAREIAARLRVGQRLALRREPTNPFDGRAIEVLTETGEKLGYVPRVHNADPAMLLDGGEMLEAIITQFNGADDIRIRLMRRMSAAA